MVTPVRATVGSSRITVACPTQTPGTSVMALLAPVGRSPISTPSWRILGRLTRASSAVEQTGGEVVGAHRLERGIDDGALVEGAGTPGVEPAPGSDP